MLVPEPHELVMPAFLFRGQRSEDFWPLGGLHHVNAARLSETLLSDRKRVDSPRPDRMSEWAFEARRETDFAGRPLERLARPQRVARSWPARKYCCLRAGTGTRSSRDPSTSNRIPHLRHRLP